MWRMCAAWWVQAQNFVKDSSLFLHFLQRCLVLFILKCISARVVEVYVYKKQLGQKLQFIHGSFPPSVHLNQPTNLHRKLYVLPVYDFTAVAYTKSAFSPAPVSRRQILLILYGFPVFLASQKSFSCFIGKTLCLFRIFCTKFQAQQVLFLKQYQVSI